MKASTRFLAVHGLVAAFAVAALGAFAATAAAAGNIGYNDGSYAPDSGSPTGTKPESKLWFNNGWRAIMFQPSSSDYRIFRLNSSTGVWSDSGVTVDPRNSSRADVLWDAAASKLYVASHVKVASGTATTAANAARLYRYSYDAAGDHYSLDTGFPVAINAATSETLTIDKDSTGTLWATWTQDSRVYVAHTVGNDATWGKPYIVPGAGTTLTSDDISSVIHFGANKIGVMWSNQVDHNFYFSVHPDGAGDASWTTSVVPIGGVSSDDHINLKADSGGTVYAAVKSGATGATSPLVLLLMRAPSGTWSNATFGTVTNSHTRPIVLLDEQHGLVHMFATCPQPPKTSGQAGGDICEKTATMLNPAFAPGIGTAVMSQSGSPDMNDVTSTKQNVDGGTGLVVMANNATSNTYWHAQESLGAPPAQPQPPVTPAPATGAQPAAGAPKGSTGASPGGSTIKKTQTKLHVVSNPRRVRTGHATRFTFRVTTLEGTKGAVRGATVKFAGRHVLTDRRGRAHMTIRFRRAGHLRVVATKSGLLRGTTTVVVGRRAAHTR